MSGIGKSNTESKVFKPIIIELFNIKFENDELNQCWKNLTGETAPSSGLPASS